LTCLKGSAVSPRKFFFRDIITHCSANVRQQLHKPD
jgi:hypothetical protein